MITAAPSRMHTPPEAAKYFKVKAETVLGWIRSGELRAVDLAKRGSRRPRFRIDPADLAVFLEKRRAVVTEPAPRGRRQRRDGETIQFF